MTPPSTAPVADDDLVDRCAWMDDWTPIDPDDPEQIARAILEVMKAARDPGEPAEFRAKCRRVLRNIAVMLNPPDDDPPGGGLRLIRLDQRSRIRRSQQYFSGVAPPPEMAKGARFPVGRPSLNTYRNPSQGSSDTHKAAPRASASFARQENCRRRSEVRRHRARAPPFPRSEKERPATRAGQGSTLSFEGVLRMSRPLPHFHLFINIIIGGEG